MALPTRARIAGILAISLLVLSAPAALGGSLVSYRPDAQINNSSWLGDNVYNTTAEFQHARAFEPIGTISFFSILIENDGALADSFKVRRSAGYNSGYRVRYLAANNTDVTGKVNVGSFTTPTLAPGGQYTMFVTAKVRSLATLCSFTSRLITVSSVGNSNAKDAVRFTLARATPDLNCPPVAVNDTASITENTTSVTGNLLSNDTDPDGDPLSVTFIDSLPPLYGAVVAFAGGGYEWYLNNANLAVDALNNGETLTQVIQYRVWDGTLQSNTATLTITIHGVTDPD